MHSKSLRIFAFFVVVLFGINYAQAYSKPGNPEGYVNDFVGVLSTDQNNALESKLDAFEKETSNEISIAIIKSLEGDTIENYAEKLFKDWGIGKSDKDNGVLVLVAIDDRKMRIENGYGLEGALTDLESSDIINNVLRPAFQQNDYYAGLNQASDLIIAKTKGEYTPPAKKPNIAFGDIFYLFGFAFLFLASILGRSKSWWAGGIVGAVIAVIIGFIQGFLFAGLISLVLLVPLGLLFDYIVSAQYKRSQATGHYPWWIGGGGRGGGGFRGFGGGGSGGGGSSGNW